MEKKLISVVVPTYNEQENIIPMCDAISKLFKNELYEYDWEMVVIDNCSADHTQDLLIEKCKKEKNIKAIFNTRNFGAFRSQVYGMYQACGDAVILIVADFQEPVELIPEMIKEWEADEETKIVCGIRTASSEGKIKSGLRQLYYKTMKKLSDIEQLPNFTGFGLYDREVVEAFKKQGDCMPFIRGMVTDFGFKRRLINYQQGKRNKGKSSFNLYRYYDAAMLGITAYTKAGLRLATFIGFVIMLLSLIVAIVNFIMKLVFWDNYGGGTATVLIGVYFLGSVQLMFLGVLGEYILSISTRIQNMPLVVEKKRINFDKDVKEK